MFLLRSHLSKMDDLEVLITWPEHKNNVKESLVNFLESNELTDIKITADGGEIRAHRILLAIASDYFRRLFRNDNVKSVHLSNIPIKVLRHIFDLIYSGETRVPHAVIHEFTKAAKFLELHGFSNVNLAMNMKQKDEHKISDTESSDESHWYETSQGDENHLLLSSATPHHRGMVAAYIEQFGLCSPMNTYTSLTDSSSTASSVHVEIGTINRSFAGKRLLLYPFKLRKLSITFICVLLAIICALLSSLFVIHRFR